MAEQKQEQRTFKWGDNEYLLDDLLKLHAEQEQSYYNFAKERGQYDDEALKGLRQAVSSRIQAVKDGKAFEGDGKLEGDTVDNVRIQTKKHGLRKKDKYVDQDNTEWAKYYVNKLVSKLTPTKKKANTWDISKHGFSSYLDGQGLRARDVFERYDIRDENNPDAARTFTQRRKLLKDQLAGYKAWLAQQGFNFANNDNDWDDNFAGDFDKFIADYDSLDNNAIAMALRKFGAGEEYTTAFTSDRWHLSDQAAAADKAAREKKAAEDRAKQESAHLREWEDYAFSQKRPDSAIYYAPFDYSTHDFQGKQSNFMNWYGDLNGDQQAAYGTYLGRDNQKWLAAWNQYTEALRTGQEYSDKNKSILLQGTFENQPHGFIDLGNGRWLIRDSISENGQGTVYDPKSGYTNTVFLGDLAGSNDEIKSIYKQLAYKYLNSKYGTDYDDRKYVFRKEGGLIPKHQSGSVVAYNWENSDESIKPKAAQNGLNVDTQKEKDRYIDSDNKSVDNPNAGWGAKETARLSFAIADLGAAVAAFVPGYGTIASAGLGLSSTFGNFATDWADDGVTAGEMWRNFGLNLGMDILGLIPYGGAAGKMTKILKTLRTTVPMIVALPGVASMLARSPEIANSWKKAFDGDPEKGGSKMTYQDYMNILQVLNVAAGATNIAKNTYNAHQRSTKHTDKLAVDVTDVKTNKRQALVLEGDDVAKFKEANKNGKAQEFIDEMGDGTNKYTINEVTERNGLKFWGKDGDGKFELFHQRPFQQTGTGSAHTMDIRFDNKLGKFYADTGYGFKKGWTDDLMDGDLIDFTANRRAADKSAIDVATNDLIVAMRNRKTRASEIDAELATAKAKVQQLQNQVNNAPTSAEVVAKKTQLEADIQAIDASIVERQKIVEKARLDFERLRGRKRVPKQDIQKHKDAVAMARGRWQGNMRALEGQRATRQRVLDDIVALDGYLKTYGDLPGARANVARLEGIQSQLSTSNHTHAYNRLVELIDKRKASAYRSEKDGDIHWDLQEILKKAGIRNAFKRGGIIDKNKLNKYLQYAKG